MASRQQHGLTQSCSSFSPLVPQVKSPEGQEERQTPRKRPSTDQLQRSTSKRSSVSPARSATAIASTGRGSWSKLELPPPAVAHLKRTTSSLLAELELQEQKARDAKLQSLRDSPVARVPQEILTMIFNHITDQPTLYSIAMVCRAFNICVTPILYAAPRFSGTFSWAEFTVTMMRRPADSRKLSAFVQMVDLAGTEPPPELTRESANAVSRPSRVVPTLLANNISLRLHTDPPPSTTPAEGLHGTTAGMATDEMGDLEIGTQSLFTAYENSYMMNGTASGSNPLAAHHATHAPPGFPTMPPGNASTGEPNAHGAWLQRATANAVVAAALMTPPPQNANMSISLAQIRQIVQASIAEHATPHPPPQHRTTTVIPVATAAQTVNIASNNGPTTSTSKKNRPPRLNLLVSALTTLSRFENLRHLSLRHSTLGRDLLIVETGDYESFQTDVPAFLNSKRLCPHEELVRLATRCPNLVSLDLGHCEWVTNALVADLVEEARALRHLNLEKCSKIAVPAAMLWFLNPIQVVSANLGTFSSGSTTHLGTTAVTSTDLGTDQGTSGGGSDRPSHSDIEPSTAVKDRRTRNNLGKSMKDLVLPHLKVG